MAKTTGSITLAEIIAIRNNIVPADYVVSRLKGGESITGIAFDLGVSEVALRAFLKRRGYGPDGKPLAKRRRAKMKGSASVALTQSL